MTARSTPHHLFAEINAPRRGLGSLALPVLLTQGDQSPPFFSKIIARLAEVIDGAEVRTLPGAGHVPHMTHPAEYVSAIGRFAAG